MRTFERPSTLFASAVARLAFLASLLAPHAASAQLVESSGAQTGRLIGAVYDPRDATDGYVAFHLEKADGTFIPIDVPKGLIAKAGGLRRVLDGGVNLTLGAESVDPTAPSALKVARAKVLSLSVTPSSGAASAARAGTSAAMMDPFKGVRGFAVLMCKFADVGGEPHTRANIQRLAADVFPGADGHWRDASDNAMSLEGTRVFGWYTLSRSYSYYYGTDYTTRFRSGAARDLAVTADCADKADAEVHFPDFQGIALQFNRNLPGSSSYAYFSGFDIARDGLLRRYSLAFLADWAAIESSTWAHEFGHTFGLQHSAGPYAATYDSNWDVMSGARSTDPATGVRFAVHTIGYHKDELGLIDAAARWMPGNPAGDEFVLERLGQSPVGNFRLAIIPIPGAPGEFYTVEARMKSGDYEAGLPFEGILIHRVNPASTGSGSAKGPAQVVDADGNGNPNDAGAIWTVGETFEGAGGIKVAVVGATGTGYRVRITAPSTNARSIAVTPGVGATGSGQIYSAPAGINCIITDGVPAPSGCSASFAVGTRVALTLVPAAGSVATAWGGACASTTSTVCLQTMGETLTAPVAVNATFMRGTVNSRVALVTVAGGGTGRVTSSPAGIDCTFDPTVGANGRSGTCDFSFLANSDVRLTAEATGESVFFGWIGGVCTPQLLAPCVTRATATSYAATLIAKSAAATLAPGQTGTTASLSTGGAAVYRVDVPTGATRFAVTTAGSGGDVELYVRRDQLPTAVASDCASERVGNAESCVFDAPQPGTYWVVARTIATSTNVTVTPVISTPSGAQMLLVAFTGTGYGSVTSAPSGVSCVIGYGASTSGTCSREFAPGTSLTLTAAAMPGSSFDGWSGACTGTGPCEMTMSETRNVSARFSPIAGIVMLGTTGGGAGMVRSSPDGITCEYVAGGPATGPCVVGFPTGASVRLTATPAAGSVFFGWHPYNQSDCPNATAATDCVLAVRAGASQALAAPFVSTATARTLVSRTAMPAQRMGMGGVLTYKIEVPPGTTQLSVRTAGGSGDADLFIRHNALPALMQGGFACASETETSVETCTVNNPQAGTWYAALFGFTAFSDVAITADAGTPAPVAPVLRGDVNGDGQITAADAQAVLAALVGMPLPNTWNAMPNGDANCNGTLEAADALLILTHAAGLPTGQSCVGTIR